jgi:hypothetical protein
MVPPVSQPSAHELKELRAIAAEAAQEALYAGLASSRFHGYEIHAYSWCSTQGVRVRVVVTDDHARPLLSQEQLHGPGSGGQGFGQHVPVWGSTWILGGEGHPKQGVNA